MEARWSAAASGPELSRFFLPIFAGNEVAANGTLSLDGAYI